MNEVSQWPEIGVLISHIPMRPVLQFLKSYVSRPAELGRIRPHDTRSGARAFTGMLLPQLLGILLFPQLRADGLGNDAHIETAVNIYLNGLRPG